MQLNIPPVIENIEEIKAIHDAEEKVGQQLENEIRDRDLDTCIRTSTERPESLDKAGFILSGIDEKGLLQSVDTAVELVKSGDYGTPVPNYIDENVSTKVVKIIQSYVGVVNKMVWRKEI